MVLKDEELKLAATGARGEHQHPIFLGGLPIAEALMHVHGRQAAEPLPPDSAKKAKQEAAVARVAGAGASAADCSKKQESEVGAAGDAPPAKRLRGPVSEAELEALFPLSGEAGFMTVLHECAGRRSRAGAR